jgi:carbamate kinase
MGRTFVALGGNALQRAGGDGSFAEATGQMRIVARVLAELVLQEEELLLSHGNGPQVGALLRQNELARREVPPRPMFVLGAETQGQIGYLVQQELAAALARAKVPRVVVALLTRVAVSPRDPAFRNPTKPVGAFYPEAEANLLKKREGWTMVHDRARGGWRRVVPSPKPVEWLERDAVLEWLTQGFGQRWVTVLGGGGGIPVVRRAPGVYEGVDAVIDKDLTAALIAQEVRADTLAIVTDVPAVAIGFHKPWEEWLREVTVREMETYRRRGEFGEGSMAPKVDAALEFLGHGGRRVIITDPPSLARAVRDEAGTRIVRG